MALLSWLPGGSGKASRLLAEYGDEVFVHAGARGALSPAERNENLNAFVSSIDRRIARPQAFARALGTTLPDPDGDRSKVEAIGQSLDGFCKSRLSGVTAIKAGLASDWRARVPQGSERSVQTLAIDLGAYCGEVGLRCAPKYQWLIDETRYTPATIMETSGRVVIGHNPAVTAGPMNNPIDAISIAAFALSQIVHYRRVKAQGLWWPNYFTFLAEVADGRHV